MDSHLSTDSDGPSFVILEAETMKTDSIRHVAQSSLDSFSGTIHSSIDGRSQLEALLRENKDLKDTLLQNNIVMKTQLDTLSLWQQDVYRTHQNHKDKFAETRELILRLREENTNLKKELESNSAESKESRGPCSLCESVQRQYSSLQQNFKRLEAENRILLKERDTLRDECSKLLVATNENLESSSTERKHASDVNVGKNYSSCKTSSEKVEDAQFILLTKNYEELNDNFKRLKEDYDQNSTECSLIKSKAANLEETLNEKEKMILNVCKELAKRDKVVADYEAQKEEMCILKTQVDVYQTDYREERAARETLAGEKAEMAERIRILEQKLSNSGLRAEASPPPRTAIPQTVTESPVADVERSAEVASSILARRDFCCPICQLRFAIIDECSKHVNECLDTPMRP